VFATGGEITSSPAVGADGTVYFTSTDGNLYALKPDGTEFWRLPAECMTESSPVLDEAGNLYLTAMVSATSITKDGKKRWERGAAIFVDVSPAVAADGTIYFSMPYRQMTAYDADGAAQWEMNENDSLNASPVIGDNGIVYICSGRLFAVSPPGRWPPSAKSSWPMFRANARHTGRVPGSN
jgi:outer membrane protein assembly factor BamB